MGACIIGFVSCLKLDYVSFISLSPVKPGNGRKSQAAFKLWQTFSKRVWVTNARESFIYFGIRQSFASSPCLYFYPVTLVYRLICAEPWEYCTSLLAGSNALRRHCFPHSKWSNKWITIVSLWKLERINYFSSHPKGLIMQSQCVCVWKSRLTLHTWGAKIMAPLRPGVYGMRDVDDNSEADISRQRPCDLCQDPDAPVEMQPHSNNMTGGVFSSYLTDIPQPLPPVKEVKWPCNCMTCINPQPVAPAIKPGGGIWLHLCMWGKQFYILFLQKCQQIFYRLLFWFYWSN